MADEHPLPEDDPDLRPVWLEMPPAGLTEAAQRQLADGQD